MSNMEAICQREGGLSKVLSPQQLSMVAVGTILSYGLLSGGIFALHMAGVGAVISYAAAGVGALLLVYCLAEMVAYQPTSGGFGSYAERYLGKTTGFMVRSAYVIGLVFIVAIEVVTLGRVAQLFLPGFPQDIVVIGAILLIGAVNLLPVQWFARLGYVLSLIKIVALLLFIGYAWRLVWMAPAVSQEPIDVAALPWEGIWMVFVLATLGYAGLESLALAAAETAAPARVLRRTIHVTGGLLVLLAFGVVLSSAALARADLLPLNIPPVPFVLREFGQAWWVFQILVVIGVLSVLNSQLYSASRMLFSLGRAEPKLQRLGRVRGSVPRAAVITVTIVALLVSGVYRFYPDGTYDVALNVAITAMLFVWALTFLAYLRFRQSVDKDMSSNLPGWPAWMGVVLVLGAALSTLAFELLSWALLVGLPFLALLWLIYRMCLTRG